jgi:AAA domain
MAEDGDWTLEQRQMAEWYFVDPAAEADFGKIPDLEPDTKPFFDGDIREEIGREDREARDRSHLLLTAWLDKEIAPRDFLMGGVMCSTSRWFVFGETGIGKTLLGMALGAAVAAGADFLKWTGQRKARVMYLDGELPKETFKERMQLIADLYGRGHAFYGYNREDLGDDGLPPLNTPEGQKWLMQEIACIEPDLIIFDSIMCLLMGSVLDEAAWLPMRPFVRWLTSKHIAQVWLHHANDSGKSFGDKTREWEMDTVIKLSRPLGEDGEPDDSAIRLEFTKARLRTPANAEQFLPLIIQPGEDWQAEAAPKNGAAAGIKSGKAGTDVAIVLAEMVKAYDWLADGAPKSPGFDFNPVSKVSTAAIRDELRRRGFLDVDEKGAIERVSRNHFSRAKKTLLRRGKFAEENDQMWRV